MATTYTKKVNLESLITDEELEQVKTIRVKMIPEQIYRIGEGAAGEVFLYKFVDESLRAGKKPRISTYNKSAEEENNIKKHLKYALSDVKVLHELNHERIIKFFGFYLDQRQIIIFMEVMKGSVRNEIDEKGHLSEIQAMHYFTQAAEGLVYLHNRKPRAIIHCDIKCENMLLTEENNVKLSDFGLAIDLAISSGSVSITPTAPTSLTGTLLLIAPEIIGKMDQPEAYGTKSDVWSLACTLVEMISGEPPYANLNFFELFQRFSPTSCNPLKYSGNLLPAASQGIQSLLNFIFVADQKLRPSAEDVLALAQETKIVVENATMSAEVHCNIESMYHSGNGIPQSYEEALTWYRKAAEQGDAAAQNTVGFMYLNGQGMVQSDEEAIKWYKKAAEQGYAEAQENIGLMYQNGQGVPQSYEEALKWYRKAAEQGRAAAENKIGNMYYYGNSVPQSYGKAMKWYRKAAEQGDAAAQNTIGFMYYSGKGVPQSYEEAMKWYRKAAEQGYAKAQSHIGFMYYHGKGVPRSYEEAMKWYRQAAEQGYAKAQDNMGAMYQNGKGGPQSYEDALKWYRKAADQGYAKAQSNIGFMYFYGRGVPHSYEETLRWLRKAAEEGDAAAQYNIGFMYQKGKGVSQSDEEALKWYRKAAEQGVSEAKENIEKINKKRRGILGLFW